MEFEKLKVGKLPSREIKKVTKKKFSEMNESMLKYCM